MQMSISDTEAFVACFQLTIAKCEIGPSVFVVVVVRNSISTMSQRGGYAMKSCCQASSCCFMTENTVDGLEG